MDISRTNRDDPSYNSDFQQSVNLFQKSFEAMQSSQLDPQKAQYVKVMHEALNTMQESASAMVNQHLMNLNQTLSHDLDTYLASPTDANKAKINTDIDQLKQG